MSTVLAKASRLKAEIRLAQAVSQFEADLSDEQKHEFRTQKAQSISTTPGAGDVMRLTAEVDRRVSKKLSGQCFGPRFTNFLQGVQQFAALGDVVVGGSQNLVACGVWALVRMSLLSIVNVSTYIDKLSSLFMEIGRSAPRYQAMALLYPRSAKLQSYLSEYFIVVVGLCRYLFKFGQKSTVQQFTSSLNDANLKAFRAELDEWAESIKEEVHLSEVQENSRFRALSRKAFTSISEQEKLANSLRVLDFCSIYNHQTTWKQVRKVGHAKWFIQRAEYQEWRNSSNACTLLFKGKLGSGKSVLLANVVDDLNLSPENERCLVAYFFCKHDIPESLQARTVIGSLARQLLGSVPELAIPLKSRGDAQAFGDTQEILELLIPHFPTNRKVYFVLDGMDECENEERDMVVNAIREIQKTLKVLVCVSFRIEPTRSSKFMTKRLAEPRIISISDNNPDIEAFIGAELERCLDQERLIVGDPTLILDIQDALLKGSQGMFLWVALQIQSLCAMKTDHAIREALEDLPKSLSETFARILHKSGVSDPSLQAKTLQIVLAAYRPLTTYELREALSVTPGNATWDPSKMLNDAYSALACCGCLLHVDEEELTVRIIHQSVKQYILDGLDGVEYMGFSLEQAQRMLADVVVTYLEYDVFGTELSRAKVRPIMAQSAPSTIAQATLGSSSATRHLAMRFLKSGRQPAFDMSKAIAQARGSSKSPMQHRFWFSVYAKSYWQSHIPYVSAQEEAILKLSTKLIRSRILELSMLDKSSWACFRWAAESGNRAVLELLLQTWKIDVTTTMDNGSTPLKWAAENGCRDAVELLLNSSKVSYKGKDTDAMELIMSAAKNGHKDTAELLLNHASIDVNAQDEQGDTLLMSAARTGNKDKVQMLLSSPNIDVNAKDRDEWTSLMWAAKNGNTDIVDLLLFAGNINVDAKSIRGWTALLLAIDNGHTCIVELLFSTGKVDVNAQHSDVRTSLAIAAQNGHKDIVELLLNNDQIDVNAKQSDGRPALIRAAQNGHKDVVEVLLSSGKIDISETNHIGWALIEAAEKGHKNIVELLLSNGQVDISKTVGRALIRAAEKGHKGVVEILLSSGKVDVNEADNFGRTVVMRAVKKGHRDIVQLLLSTGQVDVNARDNSGSSTLVQAVRLGSWSKDVVELLLNSSGIDVNAKDNGGRTALMEAAIRGYEDIAKLLLNSSEVNVFLQDNKGRTALKLAAEQNCDDMVRLLRAHRGTSLPSRLR